MTVLTTLLEITIYSAALFCGIWLFRALLKKHLSPVMMYAMWFLLIARLLMPVTVTSGFSFFVIPTEETPTAQTESVDLAELLEGLDATIVADQSESQAVAHIIQPEAMQEQAAQDAAAETAGTPAASTSKIQFNVTWEEALIALWLTGMAAVLIQIGVSTVRLKKRLKDALPVPPEWQRMADELKTELGLIRDVRVVMIAGFPSPALTAGIYPVVVLPKELQGKSDASVRFALLHEMTHITRKDHLVSLLLLLLRAVYWFNPVVWLTVKQMRLDMEIACDSTLVRPMSHADKKRYAGTMLSMYADKQVRYVLGMALGQTKKTAEKRLRGMFMRSKSSRRGRVTAALLAGVLLVACFTTACQPTPEDEIVVNKNKDLVEEVQNTEKENGGTDSPGYLGQLVLPEHYTYNSENEVASLTINVDADVYKPESDTMPFARATPMNFTQEMVTGMFNYLFPDEKPHLSQMTKSVIQELIVQYEKLIANGVDGEPLSDEEKEIFEQEKSKLEEQYLTAPDEPVISDGTLQYVEQTGIVSMVDEDDNVQETEMTRKYYELQAGLEATSLNIRVSADESDPGSSLWFFNTDTNFTTDGMVRIEEGDTLPEAVQGNLTISLEDAIAKADGFFGAGGIDDATFFAAYIVDNHGTGHVDDNWDPASDYAYKLYYTRTVDGIPVSCHATGSASSDGYSEPWIYETIEILISDDGILEIHWEEPCATTEIVEEDTELIDFDTAVEKFENAVGYTYGKYLDWGENVDVTIDVEIDSIQLNLIRLRERDKATEKAGLYVPAYVFYGYVKQKIVHEDSDYTYEGYMTTGGSGNDFYPGPMMVMAINAIDGSIINTMSDVN